MITELSTEGELYLDHRASPGFTEKQSRQLGYGTQAVGSTLFEAPTRTCNHCGTVVLINPNRQRSRAKCYHCSMYICDMCEAERLSPDYVHNTIRDKQEHIQTINSISKGLIYG